MLMLAWFPLTAPAASTDAEVPDRDLPSADFIAEINDRWSGVGIGVDLGLWGRQFGTGFKVDVPFGSGPIGEHFGARARGVMVYADEDRLSSTILAGGAELFGRGPVMLGVARVYGGGGAYYGDLLGNTPPVLVGGGHFGVEFAASRRQSISFEVGGQGSFVGAGIDGGPSVMAGSTVWLGRAEGAR